MTDPRLTDPDPLVRIEAKADALLARDTDEQVASLLQKANAFLAQPFVGRVLVPLGLLAALGWAGQNGYLTPAQQQKAAEVINAAAAPGSAPGVLAPQPVPAVVPVVVEPVVVPADVPAPMAPTE